jgi:acetyl-CoA acetyltransferase
VGLTPPALAGTCITMQCMAPADWTIASQSIWMICLSGSAACHAASAFIAVGRGDVVVLGSSTMSLHMTTLVKV